MQKTCKECDGNMNENRRKAGGYIAKEKMRAIKENQILIRRHVEKLVTLIDSGAGNSTILAKDLTAIKDLAWQNEIDMMEVLGFGRSDEQ